MPLKKTLVDLADEIRDTINELDADELDQLMSSTGVAPGRTPERKPILVDVREADEREQGYIPSSAFLPRGILERDIEKVVFGGNATEEDLHTPIICYCRGGHRSVMTCDSLRKLGFTDVTSLEGGYRAWTEAGKAVEHQRG
jgi:rhodanese-related sulfurtransferase